MAWTLKFWNSNPAPPAPVVTWNYGVGTPVPSDVPAQQALDITNYFSSIASISTLAQSRLNAYGQDIRIGYDAGSTGASFRGPIDDYILIDLTAARKVHFFNTEGMLVAADVRLTLMHELAHIYLSGNDPNMGVTPSEAQMNAADFDFRGSVVNEQNAIATDTQLAAQIQTSYFAALTSDDPLFAQFSTGISYSDGNAIDTTRWGTPGADNIDHSGNTVRLNDLLFGLGGDDTIKSGKGDDYVYGGAGKDKIWGGEDNDVLVGGSENDEFRGETGDDQVWGGDKDSEGGTADGTDKADYSAAPAAITVTFDGTGTTPSLTIKDGEGGTDTLHSIEEILGTAGRDYFSYKGEIAEDYSLKIDAAAWQTGNDIVNLDGASSALTLALDDDGNGTLTSTASGGHIDLVNFHTQIVGSDYDDTITDDASGDKHIDGGWGNDVVSIESSAGTAYLYGGSGDDMLTGGSGSDVIVGGVGADQLFGGDGADLLIGSNDNTDGPEVLEGGAGHDWLEARGDVITVRGGTGNDLLNVLSEGVTAEFQVGDGHDTMIGSGWAGLMPTLEDQSLYRSPDYFVNFIDISQADISVVWDVTITDQYESSQTNWSVGIGDLAMIVISTGESVVFHDVVATMWTYDYDDTGFIHHRFYNVGASFSDDSFIDYEGSYYPIQIQHGSVAQYDVALTDFEGALAAQGAPAPGTGGNDDLGGSISDDNIAAGDGEDSIEGSAGNDIIDGGAGDDTISFFGSRLDFTLANEGGDLVVSSLTLGGETRLSNVESIYFVHDDVTLSVADLLSGFATSGDDVMNGTVFADMLDGQLGNDIIAGREGDDALAGGEGNDTLDGMDGNDSLNGGAGADVMNGGAGDDIFFVNSLGDLVTEGTGAGADLVSSTISYLAADNVESVTLAGTSAIDSNGNGLANTMRGNSAVNVINGGDGNDAINGFGGADTMIGGTGSDTFYVDNAGDVVTELAAQGTERIYTTVTYTLSANIEEVTLSGVAAIGATGNALLNTMRGNAAANILSGQDGNDAINGFAGADTMIGGLGNDTFYVDDAGDIVTEASGEGGDRIYATASTTLAANVETLVLSGADAINGTGNSLANTVTGNEAANRIDGAAGADILAGGAGNDVFVVDDAGDLVTENAAEGTDKVEASISYTLSGNVEDITLTGSGAISGTGNALLNTMRGNSAANILAGGDGNDAINGFGGADTMIGGTGNDTYYVDNSGDVLTELAGQGGDRVYATVTYTLSANVEDMTLSGAAAINGQGNALINRLTGNAAANSLHGADGSDLIDAGDGNDMLYGELGNDSLTGGTGLDSFFFSTALNALTNVDTLLDFVAADDAIYLDRQIFATLPAPGVLSAAAFYQGTAAHDADDRIIFDAANGNLLYDSDGTGVAAAVLFAHVIPDTALSAVDFFGF